MRSGLSMSMGNGLGSEQLKHFEEGLKVCLDINGTLLCVGN